MTIPFHAPCVTHPILLRWLAGSAVALLVYINLVTIRSYPALDYKWVCGDARLLFFFCCFCQNNNVYFYCSLWRVGGKIRNVLHTHTHTYTCSCDFITCHLCCLHNSMDEWVQASHGWLSFCTSLFGLTMSVCMQAKEVHLLGTTKLMLVSLYLISL